jgi:hypothetical protein
MQVRPHLVAYAAVHNAVNHQVLWTPVSAVIQTFKQQLFREQRKQMWRAYYEQLTQYAREHGTSQAYDQVLSLVNQEYDKVEKISNVGKHIGQHSKSMMPTFKDAQVPALPAFSLSLAHNSVQRAPAPLPSGASVFERWMHNWKFIQAYTLAHNDAYKDLKIDRHFTPAWLTSFVIAGKAVTSYVPRSLYTPVSELYGSVTGQLALTFNPAQDYDTSDFTKRTLLYTGMSYPFLAQAIPRLFIGSAIMGNVRLRIICFAASFFTGGAYEFTCGYKAGTSYMRKPVEYITSIEKEE